MAKLVILVAICLTFSLANQRSYAYKNDDNEGSKKLETTSGTTTKPFLGCCFNLGNPFSFIKKKISVIFGGKKHTTSTPKSSTDKHSSQKIHEITKHTIHLSTEKHISHESVFQKKDISPPSEVIKDSTNQDEASNLNYTNRPRFSREYGKKLPRSRLRYYMPQTTFTFASRQRKYFTPSRSFVADTTKSPTFDLPQHLYHATTKFDSSNDELHTNTSAVDINDALSDLLYPSLFDSTETESSITTKAPESKTKTLKFSKPSEHNHSNVYQYNNRKLLNYGNTNNYHVRRSYRNNSSFTVRRIVGPLNDSFVSSQIIALHNMLSRSNLYVRRTYPTPYEDQRNKPRETRYTTGDLNKFLESLRLSRKPDAFKRHLENARTSNTPIWVRVKKNNMFRTYVTNPKVTRCPDFIENMEEDTSTMELYRHHKYYFGSAEVNSKDSDDSIADLLKHYEKHTPALNRFENSLPSSKEVKGSAMVMDSDEDVSLWCHFNGTFPDIRKMIIPRKYLEDKNKERKPFTATFYNRNVVITRYYPPTIEKILPPALRRKTTSAPTTPLAVSRTSLMDAPLVQAEPKLPILFPTQKVTTPKNIDPYGLLHKIMSYNKIRQTLYPNNSNAVLPGDKPHRLHPLNQLPPLLKLPFPLSQDHLVHTSDPRTQHFTILGDYRIHKDNQTLECVQNPAEFQRPLHAIAPPAGSGFYRLVQKYRVLENRTLQMISGGSKPKESNAILRIISKRRKGSNTVAVEMRFYPLPSTVSKLRKGRIPHYLLR